MKRRGKIFKMFFVIHAFFGAAFSLVHLFNKLIFILTGNKNKLNNVWRGRYGDVAFTKAGEGPPLLLVHGIGIGAGSSEWDGNIEELSKFRTVYAIDLPGFGNSEKHKMTYNSYYYACVINDFIGLIICKKTDVAALCTSGGIVLAASVLEPRLYKKIVVVNPHGVGMGEEYKENGFVKSVLPLPVIGTLVYNFISSKQSVLSFLDRHSPIPDDYSETRHIMEKCYRNAHLFGANNKYSVLSYLRGYADTPVFRLIEGCAVPLNVIVSAGSPVPMLAERTGLTITEIRSVELCPNIYAPDKFNEMVVGFLGSRRAV